MSRHNRRDELIKELGYCTCKWASPSSHHDCCINKECGRVIKTVYEMLSEAQTEIKRLMDEIEEIKIDIKSGNPELALERCREILK